MEAIWRWQGLTETKDLYLAIHAAFACFAIHFLLNIALYQKLAIWLLNRETVTREIQQGKITKCKESLWKLTYYMAVQIFIFLILYKEPWFVDRKQLFEGWPDQTIKFPLKLFYMCQCGFHIYSIPALLMRQTRRNDFIVMMSHHVITVFLIGYSYITRFFRIGSTILALHDTSDVLLETTKLFIYAGKDFAAVMSFGLFSLSWLFLRLIYYPFRIIWSLSYDGIQCLALPDPHHIWIYYVFNTLLLTLLVFHIYWWTLICSMVLRQLKNKAKVCEDIRSDSEDE
uniref:TLC domain-containing protein n=1 Tax=Picea sitchensis TaxID=3332 RepID=A9NZ69_PICSI|nr:unknown [Picea sitchensis]